MGNTGDLNAHSLKMLELELQIHHITICFNTNKFNTFALS